MTTGRFAPSPTGPLHLGNLRTALIAWLLARVEGGRFLLRIEDLDQAASRAEHEAAHVEDLRALGIDWDGPVVRQSDRRSRHDGVIADLGASGLTYNCYCTRREVLEAAAAPHGEGPEGAYPGTCRDLTPAQRSAHEAAGREPALRLRVDGRVVRVTDRYLGDLETAVDDFVLRRRDGAPAYNLAVVVDDVDQGVDQVVRGDDLWATTPRQALLADVLGADRPEWAHVPLVLGPDGRRLAKRHGAVTLGHRRAAGHTPAEVLALLGASLHLCAPDEVVTTADLLARFDPAALPRSPWVLADP